MDEDEFWGEIFANGKLIGEIDFREKNKLFKTKIPEDG